MAKKWDEIRRKMSPEREAQNKAEVDQMAKDIIASGKCCMCNGDLPEGNTTQVGCEDCREYVSECFPESKEK